MIEDAAKLRAAVVPWLQSPARKAPQAKNSPQTRLADSANS